MARKGMLVTTGLDEEIQRFERLKNGGRAVISVALYEGAAVIANAVKASIQALPVDDLPHPFNGPLNVITIEDRADLANGVGIADFDDTGDGRSTAISIEGYARRTEEQYPNGVPLPMIARSIESGSSVRRKNPFVRRAVNASKQAAIEAMVLAGEQKIDELANGGE